MESRRLCQKEFVEIPCELKDRVTHVGLCGNYMDVMSDAKDVAVWMLDRFPAGVDASKAIQWKPFDSSPPPNVHSKVGGMSLSGSVRGHGCSVRDTIVFVDDSGESGQSGTLIFNISTPEPCVLGIYGGTRSTGFPDTKKRGYLAKLPEFHKVRFYPRVEVEVPQGEELPLRMSRRRRGGKKRKYKSIDGFQFKNTRDKDDIVYGLFVSKKHEEEDKGILGVL